MIVMYQSPEKIALQVPSWVCQILPDCDGGAIFTGEGNDPYEALAEARKREHEFFEREKESRLAGRREGPSEAEIRAYAFTPESSS